MNENIKHFYDLLLKLLAIIAAAIGFGFTIVTWREQVHIKRAEFLESRIREFNDSSTYLARAILDNFEIKAHNTSYLSIQAMIDGGSSGNRDSTDIGLDNLDSVLDQQLPVTLNSEQRIRRSFDELLDFFGKLEYYIKLDLMTEYEMKYFEYYFEKCTRQPAVMKYAQTYEFNLFRDLAKRMNAK